MKVSIVILSYNQYQDTTGRCLQSLAADPDFERFDILIVDNASDAATLEYLRQDAARYPCIRLLRNQRNLGFSAGNNVGIRAAIGDIIVLLNSDAFPSPGMIGRLAGHFSSGTSWGMLGPVTNAAGNEQTIFTDASSEEGVTRQGLFYANSPKGGILQAYRLDFFCVAIPRFVLDRVGMLDEEFGRGYHEDLDYSLRVKRAGFALGVAEDVFVYHRGSASFSKLPRESKRLLKLNRKRIMRKYGTGALFQQRRQANLGLLRQYRDRQLSGMECSDYRLRKRLRLALTDLPKGWLKRWRYLREVQAVMAQLGIDDPR